MEPHMMSMAKFRRIKSVSKIQINHPGRKDWLYVIDKQALRPLLLQKEG
jgi:hypothetical protein